MLSHSASLAAQPAAAIAQAQAVVDQHPVMRDAAATLHGEYARRKFPAVTLRLAPREPFPAEVVIRDEKLFRVVQNVRAQRPTEQRTPQLEKILETVLADAAISEDEAMVLETFARPSPLTVKFEPESSMRQPVPLNPKLDAAGQGVMQRLREGVTLDTPTVLQRRFLRPNGAREWLPLFRGSAEDRGLAAAILRAGLLELRTIGESVHSGNYPLQKIQDWTVGLERKERAAVNAAILEDMEAINARYQPALFPEFMLKAQKQSAERQ